MSGVPKGPLLSTTNLTCSYGEAPVIEDINLDIAAKDFIGIVGPSGSGKSTLLRALSGTLRPLSGSVRRRSDVQIGFVPQVEHVNWDFPITVEQCVQLANRRTRFPWTTAEQRLRLSSVLERLGIADLAKRQIRALSGGQQQRMFLARALLADANLLLLDEPTSGLDVRTRHDVLHVLDELHRDGLAIVLTTHDLNGIAAHLPQLVCLNQRIIGSGPSAEVLVPDILEQTFRSPMEVLYHAGLPVVVDAPGHSHDHTHDRSHASKSAKGASQ